MLHRSCGPLTIELSSFHHHGRVKKKTFAKINEGSPQQYFTLVCVKNVRFDDLQYSLGGEKRQPEIRLRSQANHMVSLL